MTKSFSILLTLAMTTTGCSHFMGSAHLDADTSRTRASKAGTFVVSYEPAVSPIPNGTVSRSPPAGVWSKAAITSSTTAR